MKKTPKRTARSRGTPRATRAMAKKEFKFLEGAALGVIAVLIFALFCISALQKLVIHSGQTAAVISAVLVDLANGDRIANGNVGNLTVNPVLVAAAQAKANDMAQKGYFAHVSPEGIDSWHWFKQQGYEFDYAGENLAVDFNDSGDVERAWLNSPTHRKNLLDPHFTEIGIATAVGTYQGHTTIFVAQMFGKPKTSAVPAPIREVSAPSNPTEPAIATTQPPQNVLGESAGPKAEPKPTAKAAEPQADIAPPQAVAEKPAGAVKYAPAWGFLATSPRTTLQYAYYIIGALIILALLIDTGLELRLHHMRHVVVASTLLATMCVLFVVADDYLFPDPVLADTQLQQLL